ncbi:MAG: beta-hydroxyacyl-ACP dehydratase [Phycisphaerae bacterium]|nr:beta-hydroxyacyl-ACP dehydratase [Phycisphaerae bacterium]
MPPVNLINLEKIDLNKVLYDTQEVEKVNPHRFEMRQIDGIIHLDIEAGEIIAVKHVREDEFWVRGHIPGRPIFPGVLMVEASAQMSSFAAIKSIEGENDRFIGFGGIKNVKFRSQVTPGDTLYILGRFIERRPRRFTMDVQGIVNGTMVFEATVIGMPL